MSMEVTGKRKWFVLSGVILAILLSSLDQTIVATAMPRIVQELNGMEHLSWVFTAYMLGSTVTVPIYGKLSDIFGRRNLYIIGIIIFLAASALCGMATSMNQLILFRGLQGIGGGAMMVNSFAIIGDVFPPAERGRYQGFIGGVFGLSSIAGPLLGGWITDNFSWRWVFYINLPVGALAIGVLSAALPKIISSVRSKKIDFAGAFFIAATLIPLLLALVWGGSLYPWQSWPIVASLIASVVSLVLFIVIEMRVANPVLSLKLFQNKIFLRASVCIFITAMGMYGAILYVPIFAQGVIGVSATNSGLILTPMMLSLVVASAISGQIMSRTGRYKTVAITGMTIAVFAMFYFTRINVHTSNTELVFHMIVLGTGLGATMPVFTLAIQNAFSHDRLGEVTAGGQLFRNIGGTVGTAILGGMMNSKLTAQMQHLQHDPFISLMQKAIPGESFSEGGSSTIQNVLNTDVQKHLLNVINGLPAPQVQNAKQSFHHFLASAKFAYSQSLDNIFFVSGIMMSVGLLMAFLLPEVPLRKSNRPAAQEIGMELEEEFGQADDECQPHAVNDRRL